MCWLNVTLSYLRDRMASSLPIAVPSSPAVSVDKVVRKPSVPNNYARVTIYVISPSLTRGT
jgi:hypothetical protein